MNLRPTFLMAALLLIVACASPALPGAPGSSAPPVPTASPDEPVSVDPGTLFPLPGDGGQDVVPRPGQRDIRTVGVSLIEVRVNGDRIAARLTWTSGVEPCNVLDSVLVARAGATVTLTVREGSGPGDGACIEIAVIKTTVVDLGVFEPGTYTIAVSDGDAAPIEVTVP